MHKRDWTTAGGFEDGGRGLLAKESRWNLKAKNGSQLTINMKIGILVLQLQEIKLCPEPK